MHSSDMPDAPAPRNAAERLDCIGQHEQYLLSLTKNNTKYPKDCLKLGASFLAVLAFCERGGEAPDTSASDDSVQSAPSTSRKRTAAERPSKPAKKPRRGGPVIPSKTLVACLIELNNEWVLGRVKGYVHETKKYEVLDVEDNVVMNVARKNMRILSKKNANFEPKQRVLAVYPNTTVFYAASLVRKSGKNWLVEFDEEDPNSPPYKEVGALHVMAE